ncbi:hypothetical protein OH76DRAFT_266861 [Lentinus brumalis]|uniref:Uncharacterized protein n=1 Tax=Lentinus brumalis TaxID=2498619 RepID=A0A371DGU5_9APHY|nr:hypothetical protein OH76DRAFT_266861 [Polyporus brumalis]
MRPGFCGRHSDVHPPARGTRRSPSPRYHSSRCAARAGPRSDSRSRRHDCYCATCTASDRHMPTVAAQGYQVAATPLGSGPAQFDGRTNLCRRCCDRIGCLTGRAASVGAPIAAVGCIETTSLSHVGSVPGLVLKYNTPCDQRSKLQLASISESTFPHLFRALLDNQKACCLAARLGRLG